MCKSLFWALGYSYKQNKVSFLVELIFYYHQIRIKANLISIGPEKELLVDGDIAYAIPVTWPNFGIRDVHT